MNFPIMIDPQRRYSRRVFGCYRQEILTINARSL